MAHPLLVPPARRLDGVIRLPQIQNTHGALTRQLQASLMERDSLRRVKTTARNRILQGPVSSPQLFVSQPSGGVNTPGSMAGGAVKMNARRLVSKTPGQSAGV